jgi:hypothetical protein
MNKCPYCETDSNDFVLMNRTGEYSGIELSINRQGMLRVRYYGINDDTFESQDIVNIEYCPKCGRKFGGYHK